MKLGKGSSNFNLLLYLQPSGNYEKLGVNLLTYERDLLIYEQ